MNDTSYDESISYLRQHPWDLLSNENVINILLRLPYRDLPHICSANTRLREICADEGFWKMKYEHDYGKIPAPGPNMKWKRIYEMMSLDYYSFFTLSGDRVAIVDKFKQLYISTRYSSRNEMKAPEKIDLGEKIIHVSGDDEGNLGVTTENGNAYIFLSELYIKVYTRQYDKSIRKQMKESISPLNVTPENAKVLKLELFSTRKEDFHRKSSSRAPSLGRRYRQVTSLSK